MRNETLESVTWQLDQAVLTLADAKRAGKSVALLTLEVEQLTRRAYHLNVVDAYLRHARRERSHG